MESKSLRFYYYLLDLEFFSRIGKLQRSIFFRGPVKIKTEKGKQEKKIQKGPPSSSRRTGRGVLSSSKGQSCSMKKAVERRRSAHRSNPRFSFNNSYPRTRPEYLRSWTGIFEGIYGGAVGSCPGSMRLSRLIQSRDRENILEDYSWRDFINCTPHKSFE